MTHQPVAAEPAIEPIEPGDDGGKPAGKQEDHRLEADHQAGVDHILAGGAEMQAFGRFLADFGAQLLDKLWNDDAVPCRCRTQTMQIGGEGGADFGDPPCGFGGDQAMPHQAPVFGGYPPLDIVTNGTQDGLMTVRRFLDGARGGVYMTSACNSAASASSTS